ncbi:Cysteine-rich secretory protein LCCL domain-containing 2, partial [Clonorchis sinensis]
MLVNGQVPNQPRAKNLKDLKWSRYLVNEAEKWAKRCQFDHNKTLWDQGENLAVETVRYGNPIERWYKEYADYQYGPIPQYSTKMVLHYTQIMWEDTTHVGCYVNKCSWMQVVGQWWQDVFFTVCRYIPNVEDKIPDQEDDLKEMMAFPSKML